MRKPSENRNCPHCGSAIEAGQSKVVCPGCGIAHHAECWKSYESCSVHGCDGWSLWREQPQAPLAPEEAQTSAEAASTPPEPPPEVEKVCCIKCGAPVGPGRMLCRKCRKEQPRHYLENCFGPSLILLGIFVGLIVVIVRLA